MTEHAPTRARRESVVAHRRIAGHRVHDLPAAHTHKPTQPRGTDNDSPRKRRLSLVELVETCCGKGFRHSSTNDSRVDRRSTGDAWSLAWGFMWLLYAFRLGDLRRTDGDSGQGRHQAHPEQSRHCHSNRGGARLRLADGVRGGLGGTTSRLSTSTWAFLVLSGLATGARRGSATFAPCNWPTSTRSPRSTGRASC